AKHSADVAPRSTFGPQCRDLSGVNVSPWSAEPLSARARRRDTGADAVPDQFSFKFRDARKNPEHEPAVRRGRIHAFMQRNELNPEGVEFTECVYELGKASREAIVAVNDDGIEASFTTVGKELIQLRPPLFRAADADVREFCGD